MNISCDIIRDLLPLYAEDMASQDSRKLVDDHLCGCDSCTKELAALKKPPQLQVEPDPQKEAISAMKKIRRSIRLRRILAVLASALLVVSLISGLHCYMNGVVPLTAEQIRPKARTTEDGGIILEYEQLYGHFNRGYVWQEQDNYAVLVFISREDYLSGKVKQELSHQFIVGLDGRKGSEINIWYVNPETGEPDTLLWDAGKPHPAELEPEQTLSIHFSRYPRWFAAFFGAMGIVLTVLALLRKGRRHCGSLTVGAITGWCMLLSTIANADAGFQNYNGMVFAEVLHLLIMGAMFTAAVLCWRKVILLNRQDRGV